MIPVISLAMRRGQFRRLSALPKPRAPPVRMLFESSASGASMSRHQQCWIRQFYEIKECQRHAE